MNKQQYQTEIALDTASLLKANLAHCCALIRIAGSLRRHLSGGTVIGSAVSDIEIVAVPLIEDRPVQQQSLFDAETVAVNLLLERLDDLGYKRAPKHGGGFAWGDRYRRFWAPMPESYGAGHIPCDLFLCDGTAWGANLVVRTGPKEFGKALMSLDPQIEFRNGFHIYRRGHPVALPSETEKDVFDIFGLPYLQPYQRTVKALNAAKQSREVAA